MEPYRVAKLLFKAKTTLFVFFFSVFVGFGAKARTKGPFLDPPRGAYWRLLNI